MIVFVDHKPHGSLVGGKLAFKPGQPTTGHDWRVEKIAIKEWLNRDGGRGGHMLAEPLNHLRAWINLPQEMIVAQRRDRRRR
jgi:hypothetical protein